MHKSIWKKNFFRRFLASYCLILLIPVATILINYTLAQRAVREEIINSNDKSLRQFAGITDTRLAKMSSTAYQVLQNARIRGLASSYTQLGGNYGYKVYEARSYLAGLPLDEYADLFVYYKGNGTVVSAVNASLEASMYLDVYYGGGPLRPGTQGVDALREGKPNLPHITVLNHDAANPRLALLYARNANYVLGKGNLVAGVVMQPGKLQDMLRSAIYRSETVVCILDARGVPLAASGPVDRSFDLARLRSSERIVEDGASVIQALASDVVDCTYVTVTPVAVFWERLDALRAFSVVCVAICLILSAAAAILLSSRNYLPITSVLNTIYRKTSRTLSARDGNEMDFIHQVLSHSLDENEALASRIALGHDAMRDDFLLHALAGTWNGEHDEDAFSENGIRLLSDRFEVILFRTETGGRDGEGSHAGADGQLARHRAMAEGFERFCGARHQGFLIALGPTLHAGILNYAMGTDREGCDEAARDVSAGMRTYLRSRLGLSCTMAVSQLQFGLRGIHAGYAQATEALRYRCLLGKGSIIPHAAIASRPFRYDHALEAKASQLMLHHVQGEREESGAAVAALVMAYAGLGADVSMETVECFRYDLIGSLNRILHETNTVGLDREQRLVDGLIGAETLGEFEERLADMLDRMRQHHAGHKSRYTICDRAADYIHSHFRDPNLNNTGIGEALDISPSYLSKLFKEQHGLGLLDYLCKIRIREVKSLLRRTPDTVDEIAQQTGFLSSGTLIKTFKKVEGITPGAYRKLTVPGAAAESGSAPGAAMPRDADAPPEWTAGAPLEWTAGARPAMPSGGVPARVADA